MPTGDVRIGLLYSAGAVGSFLAGLAFDRVYRTGRVHWLSPATIGASAVVCLAYAAAGSFLVAAPLQLMLSLFLTTTIAVGITYRMLATPDVLRSRVNVIGRMVAWGGQPVGAALGGILAEATNPRVTIAAAAVIFAIELGRSLARAAHGRPRRAADGRSRLSAPATPAAQAAGFVAAGCGCGRRAPPAMRRSRAGGEGAAPAAAGGRGRCRRAATRPERSPRRTRRAWRSRATSRCRSGCSMGLPPVAAYRCTVERVPDRTGPQ